MRIYQTFSLRLDSDPELRRALCALGFRFDEGRLMHAITIAEDDPQWPPFAELMAKAGEKPYGIETRFTQAELRSADWLKMNPTWHCGYPQPAKDFAYLETVYEPKGCCHKCGIVGRQVAPFRMLREPRWGARGILQLNWVFDEYFVKPDVWKRVFEPLGVDRRPVMDRFGAGELKTVVQLDIEPARMPLRLEGYPSDTCGACGVRKYRHVRRGPMPPFVGGSPETHIATSMEWFGSDASAFHSVIVSSTLHSRIVENRIRGVSFTPLDKIGGETRSSEEVPKGEKARPHRLRG